MRYEVVYMYVVMYLGELIIGVVSENMKELLVLVVIAWYRCS